MSSVKESTANEYRKKVSKLEKDGFAKSSWAENPTALLDHIKGLAESTQKGYLSAIKYTLEGVVPKMIQDRIDELYKAQNEKARSQLQTPKQEEVLKDTKWTDIVASADARIRTLQNAVARHYIAKMLEEERDAMASGGGLPKKSEIVEKYLRTNEIEAEDVPQVYRAAGIPPSPAGSTGGGGSDFRVFADRMLINALYTLQAPVRLDYADMIISYGNEKEGYDGNECVMKGRTTSYFVFRKYKTDKTYGTVRIPINPKLQYLIEFVEEIYPRGHLLMSASSAALGNIVRSTFGFGVDILRHAYIMEHFPKLTTIKEKDELARRMLHSRMTQETYNLVGKEED